MALYISRLGDFPHPLEASPDSRLQQERACGVRRNGFKVILRDLGPGVRHNKVQIQAYHLTCVALGRAAKFCMISLLQSVDDRDTCVLEQSQ